MIIFGIFSHKLQYCTLLSVHYEYCTLRSVLIFFAFILPPSHPMHCNLLWGRMRWQNHKSHVSICKGLQLNTLWSLNPKLYYEFISMWPKCFTLLWINPKPCYVKWSQNPRPYYELLLDNGCQNNMVFKRFFVPWLFYSYRVFESWSMFFFHYSNLIKLVTC
jgi:hypothetical protein